MITGFSCRADREKLARSGPVKYHPDPIRPLEKIPECEPPSEGKPPLRQMIRAIMKEVAALAQRPKITQPVDRRIVVQMRGGQNHLGLPGLKQSDQIRRRDRSSPSIKPVPRLRMLPTPPGQDLHDLSMRSATPLAPSSGPARTAPVGSTRASWADKALSVPVG